MSSASSESLNDWLERTWPAHEVTDTAAGARLQRMLAHGRLRHPEEVIFVLPTVQEGARRRHRSDIVSPHDALACAL